MHAPEGVVCWDASNAPEAPGLQVVATRFALLRWGARSREDKD